MAEGLAQPTQRHHGVRKRTPSSRHGPRPGFFAIYGWMGVAMLAMFLLSVAWMAVLAVIQVQPTLMANHLMATTDFDFGDFWLLPKPDTSIAIPSAVALALCALGYAGLVILMLLPSVAMSTIHPVRGVAPVGPEEARLPDTTSRKSTDWRSRIINRAKSLFRFLQTHSNSPAFALPKLVFQTTTLLSYLSDGFPIAIIFSFASLLLVNWFIACYRFLRLQKTSDPRAVVDRIFYSFDLFFAVFAPLQVLIYAYYSFEFDRDVFASRVATLTVDSYDRTARLFADPTQVSLFRIAFQSLQLTTTTSLFIKCALNVFTIWKWRLTIAYLVEYAATAETGSDRGNKPVIRISRNQRICKTALAVGFGAAGLGIFAYATVAVVSSSHICSLFEQCKVPSYQWRIGDAHCACLVFVDRKPLITSFDEWSDPEDTTANLAALAFTGHLKIIQIINTQLPTFPEELRKCTHLQQLILVYTKTLMIPEWAKHFSQLEYLHIEGDFTTKQLTSMPRDLFVNMDRLVFLHLGCLVKLPFVPDLYHLVRLEYLVLAMLHGITEIPAIDTLTNLKRFSLVDIIQLTRVPSLHNLHKLEVVAVTFRTPACCNGFVSGVCDLTAFACVDRTTQGEPLVRCTTDRITDSDYAILMATQGDVCMPGQIVDARDVVANRMMTDELCRGVVYKPCQLYGFVGMCYPARMQPVSCQLDPSYMAMRRLQIQSHVGDVCDPEVEQWLGCQVG